MMERTVHPLNSFQTNNLESKQILIDHCCDSLISQTIGPSPCVEPSPLGLNLQQTFFLAGFRDCRQEVLRYLIDVEHVSLEGPVVLGLEQHLSKLETLMQTSCSELADPSCNPLHQSTESHPEERQQSVSTNCDAISSVGISPTAEVCFRDRNLPDQEQSPSQCSWSSTQLGLISSRSVTGIATDICLNMQNSSFDSGCESSLVSSSVDSSMATDSTDAETLLSPARGMTNNNTANVSLQEPVTESELAENALELMHLAHSNPNISRILNELFCLMDDDYFCADDDDDNDDDNDDDGVEMENEENECVNSENLDNV